MKKSIIIGCLLFIGLGAGVVAYCGSDAIIDKTVNKTAKIFGNSVKSDPKYKEEFSRMPRTKTETVVYLTDELGIPIPGQKYSMLLKCGDLYIAGKNGKYGVINLKGKRMIPFNYDYIFCIRDGFIARRNSSGNPENIYYFFDTKGKLQFKSQSVRTPLRLAKGNLYLFNHPDRDAIIDFETGKEIFKNKYNNITLVLYEGSRFFVLQKDGKYGLVTEKEEVKIPFEYEKLVTDSSSKGVFWAKKDGKYGLLTINNEVKSGFVFDTIPQQLDKTRYISGFYKDNPDSTAVVPKQTPSPWKYKTPEEQYEAGIDKQIEIYNSIRAKDKKIFIKPEGELHCVSIHEGNYPKEGNDKDPVTVRVISKTPVTLYLSSYHNVLWNVIAEKGAKINKIYYSSYEKYSEVKAPRNTGIEKISAGDYFHKWDFQKLIDMSEKPPVTFQTKYSVRGADEFLIDGKDGANYAVYPKHPANNSSVSLKCCWGNCSNLTVKYSGVGASTTAIANKYYNKGKYYFEAKFIASADYNTPWMNIGLLSDYNGQSCMFEHPVDENGCRHVSVIGWSEKILKNGDIVGIAADFDEGKIYAFVNGKPKNGIIEKKKTIYMFEPGTREYSAGVEASRGVSWEVNFGAKKFKYKIPEGFKPYDEYSYKKL